MTKKDIRSDNTYLISTDSTDNPKLGAKILTTGKESLFLDYYLGYNMVYNEAADKMVAKKHRKREFLKLYLWQAPRTKDEREANKKTLDLAKKIRFERGQELLENREGYRVKINRSVNFLDYFQQYIDNYTKKDIKMMKAVLKRFKDFLADTPIYNKFTTTLKPNQINKDMVVAFSAYLQDKGTGEGANSYFRRFKKVVNYACEHDIFKTNPCKGVSIKIDENTLRKEVLSTDEVLTLMATPYPGMNPNIKRAFIFCLYSGLRFCDVKDLTYNNVDFSNRLLSFEQSKTKGHSASSGVTIPLNDSLLGLIGAPADGDRNQLIFDLPSHTMCIKAVKNWVEKAGINKHITWHCARHSFAVNILNNGANIKTVSTLLGHSSLKTTEKYTHAVDKLKVDAINSLPKIELNI